MMGSSSFEKGAANIVRALKGVLYASVSAESGHGYPLLDQAIENLLSVEDSSPEILYQMKYTQTSTSSSPDKVGLDPEALPSDLDSPENVLLFPPPSLDLVFDDSIIERVKAFWKKIVDKDGDEGSGEFMIFEDRETFGTDLGDDE